MEPARTPKRAAYVIATLLLFVAISPLHSSARTFKVLHTFAGGTLDGAYPVGNLTPDASGNLYGATDEGGNGTGCSLGCGTVFELIPSNGQWTENVLYNFNNSGNEPYGLESGVIFDSFGNLY